MIGHIPSSKWREDTGKQSNKPCPACPGDIWHLIPAYERHKGRRIERAEEASAQRCAVESEWELDGRAGWQKSQAYKKDDSWGIHFPFPNYQGEERKLIKTEQA